ncbi:hypothetical protein N9V91_07620 [Acidimicrobiaceae bacterium]|nr:hypothetical protein [Acidimicrobiaceae bacterium]
MGWSVNRATGLTHHDPDESTFGYTLVTPSNGRDAYLLDIEGRVVHRWTFDNLDPGYGRLLDNGNLLMSGSDPSLPDAPAHQEAASARATCHPPRWLQDHAARSRLGRQSGLGV